jgi:hypothetical protein
MPAGIYECWPIASPADYRAAHSGRPPAANIRVTPGENETVMTFAPGT